MPAGTEQTTTTNSQIRETPPISPAPEHKQSGDQCGIHSRMREIVAASGDQEPLPPKLSGIFRSAEFSHPVNDGQKERALQTLQLNYGNRYVQRVLASEPGASLSLAHPTLVQRAESHAAPESATPLGNSAGQTLDRSTQEAMGSSLNHDFSGVRVHDDSIAHQAAKDLNAAAFTTGRDVYFSRGAYNPASESGRKLLAHELTHVVQQSQGTPALNPSGLSVSHPSDPMEQQAEEVSRSITEAAKPDVAAPSSAFRVIRAQPSIQRFAGGEHEQLGDVTLVHQIDLGNGVVLSWGQVVALAGDYYESVETLLKDTETVPGRMRIRAALEDYGSPALSATTLPAPTVSQNEDPRADVSRQYALLALKNISHYAGGGSATETWLDYHARALAAAVSAGLANDEKGVSRAHLLEAFGQHFLTDAFSAGHIRTPRREISDWYVGVFAPRVIDRFINQLRERFVNGIYPQVARQSGGKRIALGVLFGPGIGGMLFDDVARPKIREALNETIYGAIADVGGKQEMIAWFGLLISGSVSGPIHDIENRRGVTVTSRARPKPWQTVGDSRLSEGSKASAETRYEAEEAVLAAKDDVDRAYDIGKAEREFQEWVPNATDLPYTVYFRFDRADLSAEARKALVGIPAYMIYNPGTLLGLTGHTDAVGKQAYNNDLGRRRAQTVADALNLPGPDASRVTAATRGEDNPVTANPRQAWRNRRVEFVWSERRVSSFPTVEQERTIRAVQQQIGPPYKAERFIPTEAPGQNVALPDWHWGSLPAPLQAEISTYLAAKVRSYMNQALASSKLDDRSVEGNTIQLRPIAKAIIDELLSDPVGFLARAFGEGAGP